MYIPQTFNNQIDDLLNRIAEKLQLDDTRIASAERSYNAISEWIEGDLVFFKNIPFNIYPQGSYRIGTGIKPLKGEEFDLDIVVHMNAPYEMFNPIDTLNQLERRLRENGLYKTMLERKNRCVRINYANLFHIDILPGFQESALDLNRIVVPDRSLKDWTPTNPKGYGDWFKSKYINKNLILLEKSLRAEDLPEQVPYHLMQPIQRAVQLIKRYRDIYFKDEPDSATSSIILTTLAGLFYTGQQSEFGAIKGIINAVYEKLKILNGTVLHIVNPANPNEIFSDKWVNEPHLYKSFNSFITDFKQLWDKLEQTKGIQNVNEILKEMFGELTSTSALVEQTDFIQKARNSGQLGVAKSSGLLTGVTVQSTLVKPNNFYGN